MSCPITATIRTDGARCAGARPRTAADAVARRSWIQAIWLALALVLAQSAGFVHLIAHAPLHLDGPRTAGVMPIQAASPVQSVLLQLVGDHGDDAQCLLYDQMSHGDCAPTASLIPLPCAMPGSAGDAYGTTAPRGARFAQRARGPPVAS